MFTVCSDEPAATFYKVWNAGFHLPYLNGVTFQYTVESVNRGWK